MKHNQITYNYEEDIKHLVEYNKSDTHKDKIKIISFLKEKYGEKYLNDLLKLIDDKILLALFKNETEIKIYSSDLLNIYEFTEITDIIEFVEFLKVIYKEENYKYCCHYLWCGNDPYITLVF